MPATPATSTRSSVVRNAFFVSTQQRVTGEVHLLFRPGVVFVEGTASPYSLMKASKGAYGESAGEWTAAEAHGFDAVAAEETAHATAVRAIRAESHHSLREAPARAPADAGFTTRYPCISWCSALQKSVQ